jgi:prepilin-type N-terminal cleavage/methylation domain-containing protein
LNHSEAGFTIIELLMVVAVGSILFAISVMGFSTAATRLRAENGETQVVWQLRLARDAAVSQRRLVEVQLIAPNQIRTIRQGIPTGTVVLNEYFLEGNVEFLQFSGVPDTPDAFGGAGPVDFGGETLSFTAEGRLVDSTNSTLSGTIFLGIQGQPGSQHAVTVFGGTGRVRGYGWNGTGWVD